MSTKIEWTDVTWNPTTGCDRISPGCDHCYAMVMAKRLKAMGSAKYQKDGDPRTSGPGFAVSMHEQAVLDPVLKWPRRGRNVFLDSMSDVFHARVGADFLGRIFATMALTPQHNFQVLTKRPNRMRELLADDGRVAAAMVDALWNLRRRGPDLPAWGIRWLFERTEGDCPWPLPNVWLGTSIESDEYAWRAEDLRATPGAIRFLSLEPLLGPLSSLELRGIDWVIAGGESGHAARPANPDWFRDIRDCCVRENVAFHFKQWGEWSPEKGHPYNDFRQFDGDPGSFVMRVGKKAAGRVLDGRTWDEYPRRATCSQPGG